MTRFKCIISEGESKGYITIRTHPSKVAAAVEEPLTGAVDLVPGELWRSIQANLSDVMRGDHIAGGSSVSVLYCFVSSTLPRRMMTHKNTAMENSGNPSLGCA